MKRKRKPFKIRDRLEQKLGKSKLKQWLYPDRKVSVIKDQSLENVYVEAAENFKRQLIELQLKAQQSQASVTKPTNVELINKDNINLALEPQPLENQMTHRRNLRRITQPDFYQLCQYIQNRKAEIERTKPRYHVIVKEAGSALNKQFSQEQILRAVRTIGMTPWREESDSQRRSMSILNMIRNLTKAVNHLYRSMNEPISESMAEQELRLDTKTNKTNNNEDAH